MIKANPKINKSSNLVSDREEKIGANSSISSTDLFEATIVDPKEAVKIRKEANPLHGATFSSDDDYPPIEKYLGETDIDERIATDSEIKDVEEQKITDTEETKFFYFFKDKNPTMIFIGHSHPLNYFKENADTFKPTIGIPFVYQNKEGNYLYFKVTGKNEAFEVKKLSSYYHDFHK